MNKTLRINLSLRSLYRKFKNLLNYSVGFRLLLNSFIFALSGSTVFGLTIQIATYVYAIRYGIRLPIEGVPYLSTAIATFTFVCISCAGLLFLLMFYLLGKISTLFMGLFGAEILAIPFFPFSGLIFNRLNYSLYNSFLLRSPLLQKRINNKIIKKIDKLKYLKYQKWNHIYSNILKESNISQDNREVKSSLLKEIDSLIKNSKTVIDSINSLGKQKTEEGVELVFKKLEKDIDGLKKEYKSIKNKVQEWSKENLNETQNENPESVLIYAMYKTLKDGKKHKKTENSFSENAYFIFIKNMYDAIGKFKKISSDFWIISYRNLDFFTLAKLGFPLVSGSIFLIYILLYISGEINPDFIRDSLILLPLILSLFMLMTIAWRPKLVWWFSASLTLFFIIFSLLFFVVRSDIYAAFLRVSHFGGGIRVTLIKSLGESTSGEELSGHLLLRTHNAYFVYDDKAEIIQEIPSTKVNSILYFPALEHRLPKVNLLEEFL